MVELMALGLVPGHKLDLPLGREDMLRVLNCAVESIGLPDEDFKTLDCVEKFVLVFYFLGLDSVSAA